MTCGVRNKDFLFLGLIQEEGNGRAMHLNLTSPLFFLQGDRVIGVNKFNCMAEEQIVDQKVSLPLSINAWGFFPLFPLISTCLSFFIHLPHLPPFFSEFIWSDLVS